MELRPGYKQSEVGVVPEDWNVCCVGDSFEVCNQLRLPINQSVRERMTGPYPYYGPTGVQGWINEYRVEGEYALIGEDGDHFLKWRSQPMTLLVRGKFNVNNHAHLVRGTRNLTEWFYWFFANRDITSHLTRQGAGRYKLTKAALLQIPCVLPPPPEQSSIARVLSDADALIESLERLIDKKREIKQGAMQELLNGKKRLPGFDGAWKTEQLGEIAEIVMGQSPRSAFYNANGFGVPLIQGNADVFNRKTIRRVFTTQITKRGLTGDILMTVRAPVGQIARASFDVCLGRGVCALRYRSDFLYHALVAKEPSWAKYSKGSTFDSVNSTDVKSLEIEVPVDPHEESAIASVLSEMDAEIAAQEQKVAKARLVKQAMMQELLTGKVRLV